MKQDTLNRNDTKYNAVQTIFFSWNDIFTRNNTNDAMRNNTVISFDVTRLRKLRESYVYNSRNSKLLYL